MGRRGNPVVVGVFVVGAAALAVGALLAFGSGLFTRHRAPLVSFFSGSVNGLSVGAPVKFRGVTIGEVTDIRIGVPGLVPENMGELRLPVFYEIDPERVAALGGRPTSLLVDRAGVKERVSEGLRAQLETESFVTGVLFVGIDFQPDTPITYIMGDDAPVPEIPTVPTIFEEAQEMLAKAVSTVEDVDLGAIARSLQRAADGVASVANSPEIPKAFSGLQETLAEARRLAVNLNGQVQPVARSLDGTSDDARKALAALRDTLERLNALVDPAAPLPVELRRTVAELGEAARTIRELAAYLERNPSSVVFGRQRGAQ